MGVLEAQNWGNRAWKPSANPATHASRTPERPARSALHNRRDQVLGLGLGSAGGRLRGSSPPGSLPHDGRAGATLLYSQGLLGCNTYDFTEACLLSPQLGPSWVRVGLPWRVFLPKSCCLLETEGGVFGAAGPGTPPDMHWRGRLSVDAPSQGVSCFSLETWNRWGGHDHQIAGTAGGGGAGGAPGCPG